MAKKKHYVYLSARKIEPGQVPEDFTVFNDFGHAKTVVCGQVMSSGYGLLSYDQPLSGMAMDVAKQGKAITWPSRVLT